MPYRFVNRIATHLSSDERAQAAGLLSYAYTKWQSNPQNTNPLKTDTSPEVYERMLQSGNRETLLYYEGDALVGVFIHVLSPDGEPSPMRKLAFMGVRPRRRGFEPLRTLFTRYAWYLQEQDEDCVCTSDLDQQTLNTLLEIAGFREITDRNETYFILGRLLERKLITSHRVANDFVVDEIITLDGKALRRDKKLLKAQNSTLDFYATHRRELLKRLRRSVPDENLEGVRRSFGRMDEGAYFVSGFWDSILERDHKRGGVDLAPLLYGDGSREPDSGGELLLPHGSDDALARVAEKAVFRRGFFDFLSYTMKVLGSYVVLSATPQQVVDAVLGRLLHPEVPLRYRDMMELVLAPDAVHIGPGEDGGPDRWRLTSPDAGGGDAAGTGLDRSAMTRRVLELRGDSRAPLVYLGGSEVEAEAVAPLVQLAEDREFPLIVFDFGSDLSLRLVATHLHDGVERHPWVNCIRVQDFYQVPIMLELMGLAPEAGVEMLLG